MFLAPDKLYEYQQFPLVLFGDWHEAGFIKGIERLSSIAFKLNFPCIILPPFGKCSLTKMLGLTVKLDIKSLNTNQINANDEEIIFHSGQKKFQVQSDAGFIGPAGKILLQEQESGIPVMVYIQTVNTATPLILCGARILSSSGLSNDNDRKTLFNGIIAWANARKKTSPVLQKNGIKNDQEVQVSTEKLHLLCVIIAGTGVVMPKEAAGLASSIFGIDLSLEELSEGLGLLSQKKLISIEQNRISVYGELLDRYVQELGLWPHVRILRKEFKRV